MVQPNTHRAAIAVAALLLTTGGGHGYSSALDPKLVRADLAFPRSDGGRVRITICAA